MRSGQILRGLVAVLAAGFLLGIAPDETRADSPGSACNPIPTSECGRIIIPDFICIEVNGQQECTDLNMPIIGELSAT